jgi:prepilin-type processing-associated H-X9-DG protein
VALLLPAIQAAREAARRVQCQNNIKNLAVAVLNFENQKSALPPATKATPPAGSDWFPNGAVIEAEWSWIVEILPFMEDQEIADQFDLTKRLVDQIQELKDKGNPQQAQPPLMMCPSDSARGRFYNSRAFSNLPLGKGNYAAYVSPEHINSMRVYPGALINELQPMGRVTDGTTKTIMLAEVRTRDDEMDPRGVWAAAWAGGSLLAFDMHSDTSPATGQALIAGANFKRNTPYIPILYPGVDCLPPNSSSSSSNQDYIRECRGSSGALFDEMPCTQATSSRYTAAPRSLHPGGVNAAHVDGSVLWLVDEVDWYILARLVCINDGQAQIEGYQRQ